MKAIRSEQIDFGVVSGPLEEGEDTDVGLIPVRKIRDVIIASNKYAAGKDGIPVRAEDLTSYPLIMLEKGTTTRRYLDELLPPSMRSPDIELATSDLVLDFARRGIGIACIVEDFAKGDLAGGVLHEIKLTEPFPPRDFYLVYNKKYPQSSAAKKFIDMVLKEMKNE
jgi:DNA-binding transcriptional LysR family regulator